MRGEQALTKWDVLVEKFPQREQTPRHHLARALGVKRAEVGGILRQVADATTLLRIHEMALYQYVAVVARVWPHCPWWDVGMSNLSLHPVLHLWSNAFGHDLLAYVEQTFGQDRVLQYWRDLAVPDRYRDIQLNSDADDPLAFVPDEQIVLNPHQTEEDEEIQMFIFGDLATAACFRWLIDNRHNYGLYVYNRTGFLNDPLGLQLAYDLRSTLQEEYWAALPPDTLASYLALAQGLYEAEVPDDIQDGPLAELTMRQVATLNTTHLEVVQIRWETLSWSQGDTLHFGSAPIHVFVLEPDTDQSPAAVILTTHDEPGNPEQHRKYGHLRVLHESDETMASAFVPNSDAFNPVNLDQIDEIVDDTLSGTSYGLDAESQVFCIVRLNPYFAEDAEGTIQVYDIPGGHMFQFNPAYSFLPHEMAVSTNVKL